MLRYVLRTTIAAALMVSFSAFAVAQYPGPMPGPGNPPYTAPKGGYSSAGPAIGAAAGGAAAVAGLLYWHHTHAKLEGCVSGDGDKLVGNDNQTYSLTNKQGDTLKPGERVQVVGKKSKGQAGQPTFEVRKTSKDLGSCTTTSMAQPPK